MSAFHDSALIGASGQGAYQIERSLRFNSADSSYLRRVPSTDSNTYTFSAWIKLSGLTGYRYIFSSGASGVAFEDATQRLYIYSIGAGLQPSIAVFRDPSAWYHLVFAVNNLTATAYINGVSVISGATAGGLVTSSGMSIGRYEDTALYYFNGYLADVYLVDGQALAPTSFGEFDANGIWQPKAYEGAYGTNGFHLPFNDNSTAAALGTDTSGNNNDWTINNISVAAGAGNDSLVDSPTNYGEDSGLGGEVRGNYCTLNPLNKASDVTLSNGNLEEAQSSNYRTSSGTIYVSSGKWYAEMTAGTASQAGIVRAGAFDSTTRFGYGANQSGGYSYNYYYGETSNNGIGAPYGAAYSQGDVIGVAMDLDAGTLTFYKNNVSQGVAFSGLPVGYYTFGSGHATGSGTNWNFGQRPFAYPAPSGFKALCTANLPTPTIADGSTAMDVVTYTGTGTTNTITGLGFSPDFLWIKSRSDIADNNVFDAVRGPSSNLYALQTNFTNAEGQYGTVGSLNSDGFTLTGAGSATNASGRTFVAWTWDAGSSTVTNNDGTITSQVRANPSAGFSIVSYTGTGTAGTIGHGLGVTPGMVIVKGRGSTGTSDAWATYMTGASATAGAYLLLEKTSAVGTSSVVFNSTNPTSSVFSVGTWNGTNSSGVAFIAYAFAPVEGYSAFGSYTGNGSASSGPFVYLNFRPRWVLIKNSDNGTASSDWWLFDSVRGSINANGTVLYPNQNYAEYSGTTIFNMDFLSNGFRLSSATNPVNQSGQTHVYAAFAENPFSLARAR